jgi:hypothetical protein
VHIRDQKLDSESPILYCAVLTNQLVQAVFGDRAVAVRVDIHAVIRSGGFAVYCDSEADGLPILRGPQDQMKVSGVKTIDNGPRRTKQGRDLPSIRPLAG